MSNQLRAGGLVSSMFPYVPPLYLRVALLALEYEYNIFLLCLLPHYYLLRFERFRCLPTTAKRSVLGISSYQQKFIKYVVSKSLFVFLMSKGSALPSLVDDRATLRPRRIRYILTR